MDNTQIIPSKIHLTNIKTIKEDTFLLDEKLEVIPTYDIKVAHSMMHNLDKELVKIRLFLDVTAVIDTTSIKQGGNYEIDFFFKIEDLSDHYQINNEKPLFSGIFVTTLLAISFSTLRGMMFTQWKETYLQSVILPVINAADLLKSKR
ncbi:MAG: hypothetical protein GZ091_12345 [Paludibacter sp.]|nr:hypothetical protein [Paludibacter sp.]